jgi:virulence-associated protein VapD
MNGHRCPSIPQGERLSVQFAKLFLRKLLVLNATVRHDTRLLFQILRDTSDANIRYDDLRQLLLRLGFEERQRGSHHIFRKEGIEEKINLQRDDSKAKAYQVRQVRTVILKYKLGGEMEMLGACRTCRLIPHEARISES